MKTLRLALLWIYCLAYMALGRPLGFEWDAQPASGFTVYIREPGGQWVSKGDSKTPTFTGEFPDGVFEISVSAFAETTGGDVVSRVETALTPPLTIPLTPPLPKGVRLMKITLTIQNAPDLDAWTEVAAVSFPASDTPKPKDFFRISQP